MDLIIGITTRLLMLKKLLIPINLEKIINFRGVYGKSAIIPFTGEI